VAVLVLLVIFSDFESVDWVLDAKEDITTWYSKITKKKKKNLFAGRILERILAR
jgi:hypothetical protein